MIPALKGRSGPGMETLFGATLVLFGFRLGVLPIGDNSAFTHVRTGIDIVGGSGIPRVDPYSFTAQGSRWVVQSWLPEWTYGLAEKVGGLRLVVLQQALLFGVLAWLLFRLARTGIPLRTALAGTIAVGIGFGYWAPRPLMFGLICMALTCTVVEGRRSPWLLVPIVWLWVQSHGSFPLGLAWLGARAIGEWLDWRAWPRQSMRYVGAFLAGLAVSVVNPLGIRLLTFPFTIGGKREVFGSIREWQSPDFQRAPGIIALAFLAVALLLFLRFRLPWRDTVPVVVFVAASLVALRNMPIVAVVLAPVLGRALRRSEGSGAAPPNSAPPDARRLRVNRALLATILGAMVVFAASIWSTSPLELDTYPVAAVTELDRRGLLREPHRIAHQDDVGNYLTLRYGTQVGVFIDDRYDMYPTAVSNDYRKLLAGRPEAMAILDRRTIDVVLWRKEFPLVTVLGLADEWREIYRKGDWVAFQRVPPA